MKVKEALMNIRNFLSLVLLFFTACTPPLTPSDSGVEGRVTIGPTCPVVQVGNPCPDRPYQATLTVLSSSSRAKVIQIQTDTNGVFHGALPPGEYILHPESPGVMPHAAEIPFVVTPHQYTHVDVTYDSGIR
jgi:hypothetical protein